MRTAARFGLNDTAVNSSMLSLDIDVSRLDLLPGPDVIRAMTRLRSLVLRFTVGAPGAPQTKLEAALRLVAATSAKHVRFAYELSETMPRDRPTDRPLSELVDDVAGEVAGGARFQTLIIEAPLFHLDEAASALAGLRSVCDSIGARLGFEMTAAR